MWCHDGDRETSRPAWAACLEVRSGRGRRDGGLMIAVPAMMAFCCSLERQVITCRDSCVIFKTQGCHPPHLSHRVEEYKQTLIIITVVLPEPSRSRLIIWCNPRTAHHDVSVAFPARTKYPAASTLVERHVPPEHTEPSPSHLPTHLYVFKPVHAKTLDHAPGPSQQSGIGHGLLQRLQLCQSLLYCWSQYWWRMSCLATSEGC